MNAGLKYNFEDYLNCVKICYSEDVQDLLPVINDFPDVFTEHFENEKFDEIIKFGNNQNNDFIESVCYRIVGVKQIQNSRKNNIALDIESTFTLIAHSILCIPSTSTISSVGSQGFLSIPLFKFDRVIQQFEFLRFHIWAPELEKYIDPTSRDYFSIHSHSFNAQSWIIAGELINQDYSINRDSENPYAALFKIQYNQSLNEVNQHQSVAVNTENQIEVEEIGKTVFRRNDTYEIAKCDFHSSRQTEPKEISATFFSFHLSNETLNQSEVTGPLDIKESVINRKMYIDPTKFIKSIINLNFD